MRLGLDLRGVAADERRATSVEADRLGLWAVLIDGPHSTGAIAAAELATATTHVHLAVWIDTADEHPFTLAEEISVLDHVSQRRALVVVAGTLDASEHLRRLLAGEIVDGAALAPPPAQTAVHVWSTDHVRFTDLTGDLERDRALIDRERDAGCTHLFVRWTGDVRVVARHLATRAATPDFPQIVADMADRIAP